MITNIRLELSDVERNDLAKRIYRDPNTKVLVTRKEVTELVNALVNDEVTKGWESTTDDRGPELREDNDQSTKADPGSERSGDGDSGQRRNGGGAQRVSRDADPSGFTPSRGDEDYLASPTDTGIAAACSRILDDAALIEQFAWDTVERNRKK